MGTKVQTMTTYLMEGLCGGIGEIVESRCPYLTENEKRDDGYCRCKGEDDPAEVAQTGFPLNYEPGVPFPRRRPYRPFGQGAVKNPLAPVEHAKPPPGP